MSSLPLRLDLDSPDATLDAVGGKGAALARLAGAGLPVPPGFHVTTAAYRRFVTADGLADRISAAVAATDPDDPEAARATAERIAGMFAEQPLDDATTEAVLAGYRALGDTVPVAVRSSATAEDLPGVSFAGQMESYLGVRGDVSVLTAVRDCWASLWTDRAIEYRRRNGFDTDDLALAVVVQRLVPADASGVLFTVDPVTGDRDRTVLNAAWGLGESVVGGTVTADTVTVDTVAAAVVDRSTADKTVMTVRTATGVTERPVPPDRREVPVLDDGRAVELAGIGASIAALYRRPMDVEWVLADGRFWVVQARPVTGAAERREEWNDSLTGDFLWTSSNLGEAVPNVMTPLTWSGLLRTLAGAMAMPEIAGIRLAGNIGGRLYVNLTLMHGAGAAIGMGKLLRDAAALAFGDIPAEITVPRLPVGRWRLLREAIAEGVRFQRAVRHYSRRLPELVAEYPARCDRARAAIAAADDLPALAEVWRRHCAGLQEDGPRMLAAGTRVNGMALARLYPWLRRLVGDADANLLAGGNHTEEAALASLGPLLGLRDLAAGRIDRDRFAREWGHRCPDEMEVSAPRPGEDPAWIDRMLAGLADAPDVDELLDRNRRAHRAALDRFAAAHPGKVRSLRRRLRLTSEAVRSREITRSEATRTLWPLRDFAVRAGKLTGIGEDVFFLHQDELLALVDGDDTALARIPARRAAYRHYRSLPVYPTLIRGRFDPESWAADPNRRTDIADAAGEAAPVSDRVRGVPGAAGVVEAIARVLDDPTDSTRLRVGEVLVTKVTNIGWTPVFPRAAAVVTDIGAPLSHAAIVARELGIPAVVGCGDATTRIPDGARVRVDGGTGTVELLDRD